MTTPNFQLPTPKMSSSRELAARSEYELVVVLFTPLFERSPLGVGCWKLGVVEIL
jgi:hypothetical protein